MKKLGIEDLQLSGLRYEAICRMLEASHPPHTVARAVAMRIEKVEEIRKEIEGAAKGLSVTPYA